jgi:WD40 repeat protein
VNLLKQPPELALRMDMAHVQKIVDVVYANVNGVNCVFTASFDRSLKVWAIAADRKSLNLQITIDMGRAPLSMELATPTRILAGLDDGSLFLWDFNRNETAKVPLGNPDRITVLAKF